MNQWKSLGAAEEQSELQFANQSPHCLIEVHGMEKKNLFVDVHTTIKPFVRILVRYLHFGVEFNSWSELEIFVHGLINSFCLMNDLDSWNLQQMRLSIHRHRGCISSECSFSALLLFSVFIFYTSTNIALASFCIPLLCKRTQPKKIKMFSFPRTNIKLFCYSRSLKIYNFLQNLLCLSSLAVSTLSARGFIDNKLKWWESIERVLSCRLCS